MNNIELTCHHIPLSTVVIVCPLRSDKKFQYIIEGFQLGLALSATACFNIEFKLEASTKPVLKASACLTGLPSTTF